MKRIILLVAILLLDGCGLSEAAENTTASIGADIEKGEETAVSAALSADTSAKSEDIEIGIKDIQCTGITIPNSAEARITFRMELVEDALELGGDGPFYLYGGGVITAKGFIIAKENPTPFQCAGLEKTAVAQLKATQEQARKIYVGNMPLIAQIDGKKESLSEVTLVGLAINAGENQSFFTEGKVIGELADFQCEGELIPGSQIASITFSGRLKDGRQITGGGLMNPGTNILVANEANPFMCHMTGTGSLIPPAGDTQLGDWTPELAKLTDSVPGIVSLQINGLTDEHWDGKVVDATACVIWLEIDDK